MFEELEYMLNSLEHEPIFCFSLLIVWISMLALVYKDAKDLKVDERILISLVFFAPLLFILLFDWFNLYFAIGIPILFWLLYRNLLISGKGLGSTKPSNPPSPQPSPSQDGQAGRNRRSRPKRAPGTTDTESGMSTTRPSTSASPNRCPECGREVEDDWNVCIDCGASLE